MDLQKDIKDAINKNLPQQIGNELLTRFKHLEQVEKDYLKLKEVHEDTLKRFREISKEKDRLANLELSKTDIEYKRKTLELDQLKFDIEKEVYNVKTQEANKRADGVHELVKDMFTNPKSFGSSYKTFSYAQEWNPQTNSYELKPQSETTNFDKD